MLIRPDVPALFVEHPFRIRGLRLSTQPPRGRGAVPPTLGRDGDHLFRTRAFPQPFALALSAQGGFLEQSLRLRKDWGRALAELECDERQLQVRLRASGLFGGRAWDKTERFESLLGSLLLLSRSLEAAVRELAETSTTRR